MVSLGKEGVGGKREGDSPHLTYLGGREGVKSYFPCCIRFPLSSRVMSHIHQHFRSRNRRVAAQQHLQQGEGRDPAHSACTTHHVTPSHHQLSRGRPTPLPSKGRFPETPEGLRAGSRRSSRMPERSLPSWIDPKENQREEEEGVEKGREDKRSYRRKGEVKARQTGNREDIPEPGLRHGSRCAFSHVQGPVSPRPKPISIEAVSPSYIRALIHVTFVSLRI